MKKSGFSQKEHDIASVQTGMEITDNRNCPCACTGFHYNNTWQTLVQGI